MKQVTLFEFSHPEEEKQMKSIGRIIRDRRIQKGLRLTDILDEVGKSESYIGKIERDITFPKPEVLQKLAKVLDLDDVTLEFMIDLNEKQYIPNENNIGTPIKRVRLTRTNEVGQTRQQVEPVTIVSSPTASASTADNKATLDKETISTLVEALAEKENYGAIEKLMGFLKATSK